MNTVGIFIRLDPILAPVARERLAALPDSGVVDLEGPGTLGLVLTVPDLDTAHTRLRREVRTIPGVLVAWPMHAHFSTGRPEGAAFPVTS
ncbi:MAG: hypothetical protein QF724_09320 [Planctomycetota bacterium]|jgi:hypothetical protein|nr:hypothetical protein [Planctomycetota bacterium]MDP6370473.1 hypothetical protein [Planctomycetota bacterium]MDP6518925.1 hypothetical protein [Planctomycetota bacterium]MDP6839122.1 hypothetical protein [Planctomycetota bacterium]MDP6956430.1 hypothetical protein [Planctomycetota bacterium]